MRWFLSLFGICQHAHYGRERDPRGRLELVCDVCGRRVLALARTNAERAAMRRKFKPVAPAQARSGERQKIAAIGDRRN